MLTSAESNSWFRITASDNETYDVEKDVAVRSVLIANMMEGESGFWFFRPQREARVRRCPRS
jgi:hypothetical protein